MDAHNPLNRLVCIGLTIIRGTERTQFCIALDTRARLPAKYELIDETSKPITVIHTKNEMEMILKFFNIVAFYDPAFITGFNDSGFDWNIVH